jgi:hypothetical protein
MQCLRIDAADPELPQTDVSEANFQRRLGRSVRGSHRQKRIVASWLV